MNTRALGTGCRARLDCRAKQKQGREKSGRRTKEVLQNVSSSSPSGSGVTVSSTDRGVYNAAAVALSIALSSSLIIPPADADLRLPPIDKDPNRCERAFVGNTIGQSNAVSDRVLDLRFCELPEADLHGVTLSGALVSDANLKNANMRETVMTKMYGANANFEGADFTNAVVDRVEFKGAILKGVNFYNAVITGTNFDAADLTDANFEDALIGSEDVKRLCLNSTVKGDSRFQIGCKLN